MAFFDEVGKKISQTSQGVVQKTKDTAGVIKLNGMISDEQKKIEAVINQIGKLYYELKGKLPEDEFADLIAELNASKEKIESYNDQIRKLKGIATCANCGSEIATGVPFCSHCGAKVEQSAPNPAPEQGGFCTKCGAKITAGAVFCIGCGAKLSSAEEAGKEPAQPEVRNCPNCGKELSPTAQFCTGCGTKIGE